MHTNQRDSKQIKYATERVHGSLSMRRVAEQTDERSKVCN